MADWLLVHPPLLGPAVLRPLADELRARGLSVAAPDLRGTVTTAGGWPARWIEAEGHELPADFYDVAVPLPTAWPEDGARYVQLSQAYDADAAEAAARGWPVAGGSGGNHLDVVTEPPRIADLLG